MGATCAAPQAARRSRSRERSVRQVSAAGGGFGGKMPKNEPAIGTESLRAEGKVPARPLQTMLGRRMPLRYLGLEEQFDCFMDGFYIENKP
jgi:hypothetical protein